MLKFSAKIHYYEKAILLISNYNFKHLFLYLVVMILQRQKHTTVTLVGQNNTYAHIKILHQTPVPLVVWKIVLWGVVLATK